MSKLFQTDSKLALFELGLTFDKTLSKLLLYIYIIIQA